jgi:hypothetical protein
MLDGKMWRQLKVQKRWTRELNMYKRMKDGKDGAG